MPTYEYECKNCGYKFEMFQDMTDKPLKKCPECGGTVNRLIGTGGGFIFKGGGFYATDYRSESYKKGEKADKPEPEVKDSSKKTEKASSKKASEKK